MSGARVVLLGREQLVPEAVAERSAGPRSAAALSVGSHVAVARKRGAPVANEDALLVADHGDVVLHAVADGHWGHGASHGWIELLAGAVVTADDALRAATDPAWVLDLGARARRDDDGSETTLLVVALDRVAGHAVGHSVGDSAAFRLGGSGRVTRLDDPAPRYLAAPGAERDDPPAPTPFRADVAAGDLLLTCSDGVTECCYGRPEASIRPRDMAAAWLRAGPAPLPFVHDLTRLALAGVRGFPGGEDNVAVAASLV